MYGKEPGAYTYLCIQHQLPCSLVREIQAGGPGRAGRGRLKSLGVKAITARRLFEKYPGLRMKLRKRHVWNPSYYIETVGSVSEENIRRYIAQQKKVR